MAQKPQAVRWERKGHTEAKHRVLVDYLAAWIPILATQADDLILVDGFAGPGRYENREKGSPLLMLDAYARRGDRRGLGVTAHFFFIERDPQRAAALQCEVDKRKPADDIEVRVIEGDYDKEFPSLLDEIDKRWPGSRPPIFAFIDPFGGSNTLELTNRVLRLPRCEALIFVPMFHFARLVKAPDLEATMNGLFGSEDWKTAREISDFKQRLAFLVELFRAQMKKTAKWARAFEIVPSSGSNTKFLFFGTSNKVGLARMKSAMWKLDPVAGQRFRDSTNAADPVLFEPEPDTAPLLRALKEHFGSREFAVREAEDFTLFETPFVHDQHLKTKTLAPAERAGELEPVNPKPKRRKCSYKEGSMKLRFVAAEKPAAKRAA